jgi:hypothetical protein
LSLQLPNSCQTEASYFCSHNYGIDAFGAGKIFLYFFFPLFDSKCSEVMPYKGAGWRKFFFIYLTGDK